MPRKRTEDLAIRERDKRIGALLRAQRNKLGLSAEAAAGLADLSGSFLTRVENGVVGIGTESLSRIAGVLHLSLDAIYAAVSTSNVEHVSLVQRAIPILDYVQAGNWRAVQQNTANADEQETMMVDLDYPPSSFGLRIKGDSMLPEFREGDLVVVAPTVTPKPGDFVVATEASGEATFKQFRSAGLNEKHQEVFELHPLNPLYAPMRSDRQKLAIVGTMIEHRRFRRR